MENSFENNKATEISPTPFYVLEIGSGSWPNFAFKEKVENLDPRAHYIGVDIGEEELAAGKTIVTRQGLESDRATFVKADARHLPFGDESVSQVLMNNILGCPESSPSALGISADDKRKLIREAHRVLKSGGELLVTEVYSPVYAEDWLEANRIFLERNFELVSSSVEASAQSRWVSAANNLRFVKTG